MTLFHAQERTWPAPRTRCGPFTLRSAPGAGRRANAATADGPFDIAAVKRAEAAMAAQGPLFLIRGESDGALDQTLETRGYVCSQPSLILAAPIGTVATTPPPLVTAFTTWEPLAITREIWAEGGIGPARQAIMARVTEPKTSVLSRHRDRAAGAAFVAVAGGTAFCHALYIAPDRRMGGAARNMLRAAAFWARAAGAKTFAVLVEKENAPARALFASLGLAAVEQYHFRSLGDPDDRQPDPA
ncbi:L-amino acid N-acyltransferase YncA [Rhodovulum imhoffii]|uniref:L-amino acid N-acyltransferase YncA n=1 Tax=Rhodovulum imhoffii TaxID=365340 RepID=A0A2T5BU43_9RHOB|nr:GNAT family N-acetyltransferase [Rhodovulum imhoffii]MBK5934596.1 hypothetical protein [Rhodovulum imhoffii]PTN02987.1 L-amino acid N-acyltransferase YncA [Rhodovulum imhoffii]